MYYVEGVYKMEPPQSHTKPTIYHSIFPIDEMPDGMTMVARINLPKYFRILPMEHSWWLNLRLLSYNALTLLLLYSVEQNIA